MAEIDPGIEIQNEQIEQAGRLRHMAATAGKWAFRAMAAGAGFNIALSSQYAVVHDRIGPAEVEAHMTLGDGDLTGEVALLGPVTMEPSMGPFGMDFQLKEIPDLNVDRLQSEFQAFEPAKFEEGAMDDMRALALKAGLQGGALGILGGGVSLLGAEAVAELIRRQGLRRAGKLGAIGIATASSLAAAGGVYTWHTFDSDRLRQPSYSDSFEEVMGFVNSTMFSVDRYRQTSEQATEWLNNILTSSNNAEQLQLPSDNLIPILAVSDIHGRPCTLERMQLIIERLNIAFVIDAGDMSEWDEPATEAAIFNDAGCGLNLSNYGDLGVPVYTVLGNHDGSDTLRSVEHPNVTVLSGDPVLASAGDEQFTIIGDADPRMTVNPGTRPSEEEEYQMICDLGDALGASAQAADADLLVVHSPTAAERAREVLGDDGSWIVAGHAHRFSVDPENRIVTLGTAGGAGFRTFEHQPDEERVTMQFQVLYLDAATRQVAAIVRLRIRNDGSATSDIEVLPGAETSAGIAIPSVAPN